MIANEMFCLPIPVQAHIAPEDVRRFNLMAAIEELHLGLETRLRRHVFLRLECRHIFELQFHSRPGVPGQRSGGHVGAYIRKPGLIGNMPCLHGPRVPAQPEALFHRIEVMLHGPHRIGQITVPRQPVLVFHNAACSYVRQREGLGRELLSPVLDHCFFKRFSPELHNRFVRMNGAGLKVANRIMWRNLYLDVRVLLAFFSQHLDAFVNEFRSVHVVPKIGVVKLHGRGPRIAGHIFHLQVPRSHRQPLFRALGTSSTHREHAEADKVLCPTHHLAPSRLKSSTASTISVITTYILSPSAQKPSAEKATRETGVSTSNKRPNWIMPRLCSASASRNTPFTLRMSLDGSWKV